MDLNLAGICLCFIFLVLVAGTGLVNSRYPPKGWKEETEGEQEWAKPAVLCRLYPTAAFFFKKMERRGWLGLSGSRMDTMKQLYAGWEERKLVRLYYCRLASLLIGILWLAALLILAALLAEPGRGRLYQGSYIIRKAPGEGEQQVSLKAVAGRTSRRITVSIPERQYTPEELEAHMSQAETYVRKHYLGENERADRVTESLELMNSIPGEASIEVVWRTDRKGVVKTDGSLDNRDLEEAAEAQLTAVFKYGQKSREISFDIVVCPANKTEEELFWEQWKKEQESLEQQTREEELDRLPQQINGQNITYHEERTPLWQWILLAAGIACCILPASADYWAGRKLGRRQEQLGREYPELVDRFVLLIGAGLTIKGAWWRITDEYLCRRQENKQPVDYLYEEMLQTRRELENGSNEFRAYEAFGRRISLLPYIKFSSLLVQNLRKGSQDILQRMEAEAKDAFQERRQHARAMGEQAGTKLVFPMLIMLVIVFAMILAAAFWQL